jgi:hypothetical protein
MIPRKKRNSSKVNLTISIVFHTAVVLAMVYLAARQGILGAKLKEITVTLAPKEKKPEPPKEKPPVPKLEPPKPAEAPKTAALPPPPRMEAAAPPPPASDSAPAAAPAPVELPAFAFSDGAHEVQSVSDPNILYKGLVEHALRSRWTKPDDLNDENFVAEVELNVDPQGNLAVSRWVKTSGNTRWDNSVKSALTATTAVSRPPPKGFPSKFITRFDVESQRTEEVIHVSSR